MNKRLLLSLYNRSGLGAYMPVDLKGHELEVEEHMEKFAELIVKRIIDNVECHASLFNTKEARQVCSWIVKSVKYDFGVEE